MRTVFLVGALVLAGAARAADGEDCTRYYNTVLKTVTESCTPTKPAPIPMPSAKPLSQTAPGLSFPAGVKVALVERVIDAQTILVRYDFMPHYLRLADVALPERNSPEYRQALGLVKSLAMQGSSVYFEATGELAEDRVNGEPVKVGYVWQMSNQLNMLLVELGFARFGGQERSGYFDVMQDAQAWAQERRIGVWSTPK